jgi:hypothetical protein
MPKHIRSTLGDVPRDFPEKLSIVFAIVDRDRILQGWYHSVESMYVVVGNLGLVVPGATEMGGKQNNVAMAIS